MNLRTGTVLLLSALATAAGAQHVLVTSKIVTGSGSSASTSYLHSGTAGQFAVGFASSEEFRVSSGFWGHGFGPTSSADPPEVPAELPPRTELLSAYPNPIRDGAATIRFALAAAPVAGAADVEIVVCDVQGRLVRDLSVRGASPGYHAVTWDGRDEAGHRVPAGIYFYTFRTGTVESRARLVLLR